MATGTEGVGAGGNAFITSLNPAALRAYVCAMESGMIGNIWSPTAVGSPNVLSPSATLVAQPNRSNPNTHRPAATNAPCGNNADDSKPKRSRAPVRRCDSASAAEVSHVVVGAADPGAAPPSLGRSRTNTEAPRIVTRSQISPPPSLGTTVAAAAGKSRTTARSHNRTRSVSCIQSSGLEFHFPLSLAQGGAQGGAHGGAQGRAHEVITSPPAGPGLSAARNAVTAANDGKVKLTRALTEREGASGGSSGSGGSGAGSSAAGSRREFIRSRTASERVGNFDNSLSPRATTRSRSPKSFVASPEAQRAPPLPARSSQGSAMAPPAPSAARGFPDLYPDCGNTDGSPRDPLRKSDSDASVDDLYPSPGAVFPRFATIGDVSCAEGLDTVGNDNVNGNAKAKKKLHPALSRRSRSAGSQSAAALAASMGIERGAAVTGADVGGSGGSRTGPPVVQLAPRMGFVDWAGIGSPKTAGTVGGTSFGVSSGGASGGGGGSGASKLRLQPLDSSKSPSSPSPSPRFPVAIPSPSAASQLPAGFTPGSRSLPPYSAGAPPLSPLGRAGAAIVPRPTHRRAISAAQLSPRVPSPSARLVRPPSSPSVAGKAPGASAPLNAAAGAGGTSRSASASASVPAIARSSPRARIVQSATAPSSAAREATAEDGGAYAESTCATVNRAGKPMPRSMSAEPVLAHPVALEAQAAQTKQNHVGQPQPQPQQQQQLQGSSREHVGNYRRAAPTPLAVPSRRRNSMSSMPQGDAASKSALAGLAAANGGVRIGSARGQGSPGAGAWPARSPVGTAGGRLEGTSGEGRTGVTGGNLISQQPRVRGVAKGPDASSPELSPSSAAAVAAASAAFGRAGTTLSQSLPTRTSSTAQPPARFSHGSAPNSPAERSRAIQTEAAGSASTLANAAARLDVAANNCPGAVTNVTFKTKVGSFGSNINTPDMLSPPSLIIKLPPASAQRVSPPPVAPSPPRSSPPPVAPAPGGDSCKEQQVGYNGRSLSQQQQQPLKKRQQAASRRTCSVDFDFGRSKSSSTTTTTTSTSSSSCSISKSPVRASGRGGAVILTSPCPSPSRAQVVFIDGVPMPLRSALKSPSIDNGLGNTGSNLGNTGSSLGNTGGKAEGGRSSSVSPIFRHASPLVGKGGEGEGSVGKEGREGKEGKGGRVLHPQAQSSPRRVSFSGFVEVQEYVRDSEGRGRTRGR